MKPIVHYLKVEGLALGQRALVLPVDHPDGENVSNTCWALTTPVQSINGEEFQTWNTIYRPVWRPKIELSLNLEKVEEVV